MIEGTTHFSRKELVFSWISSVIISAAGLYFILSRGEYSYLDYFALIIHEAGHFLFGWGGEVIMMMGGTLIQLIVPGLLIVFSIFNRFKYFMQVSLFMLLHNLINISVYAGDAAEQKLKLFGPPGAKHDWNFLLTRFNALEYAGDIASGFVVLAWITLVLLLFVPLWLRD
ncbi:MAG: hypothetical protein HY965_08430 [Ignavibacteriales bacterium]|nr:hypothetical protein [Ignavibacteriales bacterium]